MAAPVVSGVAALVFQRHPEWTPDQVKSTLIATARNLDGGVDEVNASAAVAAEHAGAGHDARHRPERAGRRRDRRDRLHALELGPFELGRGARAPDRRLGAFELELRVLPAPRATRSIPRGRAGAASLSWSRSSWSTKWSLLGEEVEPWRARSSSGPRSPSAIAAPRGQPPADAAASTGGRGAEAIVQFERRTAAAERRAAVRAAGRRRRPRPARDRRARRAPPGGRGAAPGPHARRARRHPERRDAPGRRRARRSLGELEPVRICRPPTCTPRGPTRRGRTADAPATGAGVAVAVIDTGIAGELPDFRASADDPTSRVIASVVTNPDATTPSDRYGHGTHVAGLMAGNGRALSASDPSFNRYIGAAPQANLVSIKVSDDHGNAYLIDVIAGLQFVVDHGADYGIRVVNLSLGSSLALPYQIDPLNAAVEAAWAHGVVVVVAAGNRGSDPDAVSYAPANDPYAITVGAVDDQGTKDTERRQPRPVVEPRRHPGRVRQAGHRRPGRAHRRAAGAGQRLRRRCARACVVDERYFRIGGTSMAAPIVAGIAADIISRPPRVDARPGQGRPDVPATVDRRESRSNVRPTSDGAWEVAADSAINASKRELESNQGLTPSWFLDPVTGAIDYTRASWRRASWRTAVDGLRASWRAASWSCDCAGAGRAGDPTRASWRRASWRSFFGDSPSDYGELGGGSSGAVAVRRTGARRARSRAESSAARRSPARRGGPMRSRRPAAAAADPAVGRERIARRAVRIPSDAGSGRDRRPFGVGRERVGRRIRRRGGSRSPPTTPSRGAGRCGRRTCPRGPPARRSPVRSCRSG